MQEYQQRVVVEKAELDMKIISLSNFIGTEIYFRTPEDEQARLRTQAEVMASYSAILGERIENFS